MLGLVKVRHRLKARSLCQVALEAVGPPVVLAGQDGSIAAALGDDRKSAVTADVMKGVDLAVTIHDQEEGEAGFCEGDVVTSLLESDFVCEEDPFSRKDGSAFKLVHGGGAVP